MAHILVIDDDDQLRDLLKLLLMSAGHIVSTASEGEEGLRCFCTNPADLVITDIVMPNQEGIETIMKLRSAHPHLGIIAMSGGANYSKTWLAMASKLGASYALAKPFTLPQLTAAVDAVLALRSAPTGSPR